MLPCGALLLLRAVHDAMLDPMVQGRAWRVDEEDANGGAPLLEHARDSCNGAAGPRTHDKGVNVASCLLPDLFSGSSLMRTHVRKVVVLVAEDGAVAELHRACPCDVHRVVRVRDGRWLDHLQRRPESAHQPLLLCARVVGRDQKALVPASTRDQSQADACGTCCRLDDGAAWAECAALFSVEYDGSGHSIFRGATWIHELSFGKDATARLAREGT
mmetsp:Transcript_30500/g.70912  ORF Transcript_30500/g.70912 Transcript_30500/m.70912 type:complete len:216 (+) Transcript_30500:402-1049(+)